MSLVRGRAAYNSTQAPTAPRNLAMAVGKRLRLRGMLVPDHADLREEFVETVGPLVRAGTLRYQETVVAGLEHAPEAFVAMLRGGTTGKTLVTLGAR